MAHANSAASPLANDDAVYCILGVGLAYPQSHVTARGARRTRKSSAIVAATRRTAIAMVTGCSAAKLGIALPLTPLASATAFTRTGTTTVGARPITMQPKA